MVPRSNPRGVWYMNPPLSGTRLNEPDRRSALIFGGTCYRHPTLTQRSIPEQHVGSGE